MNRSYLTLFLSAPEGVCLIAVKRSVMLSIVFTQILGFNCSK